MRARLTPYQSNAAIRAVQWIKAKENSTGGICVHSRDSEPYPEVTGYLLPTLVQYGENDLATRLLRWLLRIQGDDGSFRSPAGNPHIFDTAQALRGLLALTGFLPGAREASQRAAAYIHARLLDSGEGGLAIDPVWIEQYSENIPESVHLYALSPLKQAARVLGKAEFNIGAERCIDYYIDRKDALRLETLTHFLGYELEALLDLGRSEVAIPLLNELRKRQSGNGSVRGKEGVAWVCTPGLAQLATCWYKLGETEPADRAMSWLEKHQMPSGGFLGSYGRGASYFPDVEPSWAVKFYLDANLLRSGRAVARHRTVDAAPESW